jgi:hypothetical protein
MLVMVYIKLKIDMAKLIKNYFYFLNKLKNEEESDSSVCESIDEISKQEIEDFKKSIKFKLTGIDYETYIKQFCYS